MTSPQTDPNSEHDAALRAAESHRNILRLLKSIAEESDRGALASHLDILGPLLVEHFKDEERPGGLLQQLESAKPEYRRKFEGLRQQHREVLGLVQWVAKQNAGDGPDQQVFAERDELVRVMRRHEGAEGRLMTDVMYIDLGVGD